MDLEVLARLLFGRGVNDLSPLQIASLAAAQELEDRNQLMLGFTANLPEAMAAFSEGREPVYTDEPRRDLFS